MKTPTNASTHVTATRAIIAITLISQQGAAATGRGDLSLERAKQEESEIVATQQQACGRTKRFTSFIPATFPSSTHHVERRTTRKHDNDDKPNHMAASPRAQLQVVGKLED